MKKSIFKKYDIRGRVSDELLLSEVYDLGRAMAVHAVEMLPRTKNVVVGMDGRVHSQEIKEELCRALLDSGLEVSFLGICPTPLVYFASHIYHADFSIMITASHNGPEYNGFKLLINKETIWGKSIERIYQLYVERARIQATCKGSYQELSIHEQYCNYMVQHFPHLVGMSLPIVFDCGHGATGTIIPELIERFEWKHVKTLFAQVDGTFPVHHADPVKPENMQSIYDCLMSSEIQCGIGFDGDGDRMAAMTKSGILVMGDMLLAIFCQSLIGQHQGAKIVFDAKCSSVLAQLLTEWGAQPIMAPSGHPIIKAEVKKNEALLGGELSCHFVFNDRYFGFDDGIYAALRLIEILLLTRKTLDELISFWPPHYITPELRIPCDDDYKESMLLSVKEYFMQRTDVQLHMLDGVRIIFPYGAALIRLSHTEPVVCVRWESETEQGFEKLSQEMEDLLLNYCPLYIPGKHRYDVRKGHEVML